MSAVQPSAALRPGAPCVAHSCATKASTRAAAAVYTPAHAAAQGRTLPLSYVILETQ